MGNSGVKGSRIGVGTGDREHINAMPSTTGSTVPAATTDTSIVAMQQQGQRQQQFDANAKDGMSHHSSAEAAAGHGQASTGEPAGDSTHLAGSGSSIPLVVPEGVTTAPMETSTSSSMTTKPAQCLPTEPLSNILIVNRCLKLKPSIGMSNSSSSNSSNSSSNSSSNQYNKANMNNPVVRALRIAHVPKIPPLMPPARATIATNKAERLQSILTTKDGEEEKCSVSKYLPGLETERTVSHVQARAIAAELNKLKYTTHV